MTPDETLRKAASLMRELASAAEPGPWAYLRTSVTVTLGTKTEVYMIQNAAGNLARLGAEADAEYVASMHPAVALAVAGWLDDRATDYFGLSDVEARVLAGDTGAGTEDPAITVARTYLGSGQ